MATRDKLDERTALCFHAWHLKRLLEKCAKKGILQGERNLLITTQGKQVHTLVCHIDGTDFSMHVVEGNITPMDIGTEVKAE